MSRWHGSLPVLIVLVTPALFAAQPATRTYDFDADVSGSPPAGFELARTGQGAPGSWIVRPELPSPPDRANHVLLQQRPDPTDYPFPLWIPTEGPFNDVTLPLR